MKRRRRAARTPATRLSQAVGRNTEAAGATKVNLHSNTLDFSRLRAEVHETLGSLAEGCSQLGFFISSSVTYSLNHGNLCIIRFQINMGKMRGHEAGTVARLELQKCAPYCRVTSITLADTGNECD